MGQNDSLVKYDDSQLSPLEISQEQLQKYLDDDAFDYEITKTENGWWDSFKNWLYAIFLLLFQSLFGNEAAVGALATFLRILPYVLLAILLFLIIRFFIKANTRSLVYTQNNPNVVSLSEEERIIKTANIQQLIEEALVQQNYRLAIRYYYLFILQLLTERDIIEWELQKTNDDYITELNESKFKSPFSTVTLLYDYIWYGEFNIDKEHYGKAEKAFAELKNSILDHV